MDVALANSPAFAPFPGDVSVKAVSYGYKVTSLAKDERANPLELVLILLKLSPNRPGLRLKPGNGTFGRQVGNGVELLCSVLIVHDHRVKPGGVVPPGGGGPPAGGGPPGGGTPPGPGTSDGQPPTVGFTFTPNAPPGGPKAGEVVHFDGSSSHDPDGTIVTWSWSVG